MLIAVLLLAVVMPASAQPDVCCECNTCGSITVCLTGIDIAHQALCNSRCVSASCGGGEVVAGSCASNARCDRTVPALGLPAGAPLLSPAALGITALAVFLAGLVPLRRRRA